ncbi:MAG: DUF3990 domain-containing protein [Bacilli bacterium]|nr:DUF3990 domain-containing protein [Bacilli bacterium]
MKRILYHGSEFIIRKPEYSKGNRRNDYGLGLYCCSNKALAKEWAAKRNGHGYINRYEIRDDRLKILDLTKSPYDNVLYWVALLMHNRELSSDLKDNCPRELDYLEDKYLIDVNAFDVIIGYRADDSYFRFPEAFVRSEITLESLNKIFKAGNLGKQYVLVSERAFKLIHFLDYEEAFEISREDYYKRKNSADKAFADLLNEDRYSKGTRMRDLVMEHE